MSIDTTIIIVAVITFVIAVYFSLKFITAKMFIMFGLNPNAKIADPIKIKTPEAIKFNFEVTRKHGFTAIVTMIVCLFIFFSGNNPQQSREQDRARIAFHMIEASKDGVSSLLKDPKSAVFQNVGYVDHLTPAVCGQANSRNSFGGMTGFQRFIARGETMVLLERQSDDFYDA